MAEHRPDRFWQTRASGGEAAPQPSPALPPAAWGRQIALSTLAELIDLPCIIGDFVALNPALRHPALERPVAFLDGFAVVPLLRRVRPGITPAALVGEWSAALPPAKAAAIARFLLGHRVLVPAGGREGA